MIRKILLTYDVNIMSNEVKKMMKENGYFERIRKSLEKSKNTLPDTALWKKEEELTTATALNDLQEAVNTLNRGLPLHYQIKVEKALAVEFTDWEALEN